MIKVNIRPATFEDLKTLKDFEQGVIETERPFDITIKDNPVSYYNIEEMITKDDIELLVAETDGRLIGSGYAIIKQSQAFYKSTFYAYLGFMYVVPAFRGMGINSLIITRLKTWAYSKNITELRLQVYDNNIPSINAYEKVGFTKHLVEMRLGLDD